jgi:outer membrane protein
MKKSLLLATALLLIPGIALAQPKPAAPQQQGGALPAPKIVVINRQAILQFSKVGQDIARQVQAYATQAKADMQAQSKALETEGQQLQQQIAILAPDVKQKKIDAFQQKEAGLQSQAQRREAMINGGLQKAQQQVEGVMGPILQGLMTQRGANMIIDKNAVVFANSSAFDITGPAIEQLNQKISTIKVTLQMPPQAGAAPALAPAGAKK